MFKLLFSERAESDLLQIQKDPSLKKIYKAVLKSLGYLQINPRHPSLNTHKFKSITTHDGKDVFEAYAENNTPGAYRIFWCNGPSEKMITIIMITPHP